MNSDPEISREITLERFLASVEKKAFRMSRVATGNNYDSLDIVQDAMMAFVKKYRSRDSGEWQPLFYKVLQNRIRDWYRRQSVRNRWRDWLAEFTGGGQENNRDPVSRFPDRKNPGPAESLEHKDAMVALESALHKLPLRQQQVFLLRIWEGMSINETASAMGCASGSVKSHYARAVKSLREELEDHWP